MKRPVLILSVVACLAILAFWLLQSTWRKNRSNHVQLPAEDQVTSILAWTDDHRDDIGAAPLSEFSIGQEYVSVVLNAFSPAERFDNPSLANEKTLGHLIISNKDGARNAVDFFWSGNNRLCFTINGHSFVRGGEYKPIDKGGAFIDESLVLYNILRAIKQEQQGQKGTDLERQIQYLKRSKGEIPP